MEDAAYRKEHVVRSASTHVYARLRQWLLRTRSEHTFSDTLHTEYVTLNVSAITPCMYTVKPVKLVTRHFASLHLGD